MNFGLRSIIVTQGSALSEGIVDLAGHRLPCILGRSGITVHKREGDGATPAGSWPLRRVLYRPDRMASPATVLPIEPIKESDGWCDDPADPFYNRPVQLPYPASAEAMWRPDGLYDIVIVLGHNDNPVVRGLGSAIFMHLADPQGRPTAGCVALQLEDLRYLLQRCDRATELIIRP